MFRALRPLALLKSLAPSKLLLGLGIVFAVFTMAPSPASANTPFGTVNPTCSGYTISISTISLVVGDHFFVEWTINGLGGTPINGTTTFTATGSSQTLPPITIPFSPLAPGTYTPSGFIELQDLDTGASDNTQLTFSPTPLVCGSTPPGITVTKTADAATVTHGGTAGFTVTITNTGGLTDMNVTLSDPLPAGAGKDINWKIDTTTGNPTDFAITGAVGTQSLVTFGAGTTLAAGASESVHITGVTSAADVSSSSNPALTVGGLSGYVVLYEGTGTNQLSITNDTVVGNIGVGGGQVEFNGPGTINGRVDFSAANTGQFHNTNSSNVGPTSVNYNVVAVTTAINAANSLSSSLGALPGTAISFNNANVTINESSGMLETAGGITYRVFNVTSYSENNADTVTIVGDGSGDPVVFNFAYNNNTNLGGQVALTGGLGADQVIWNFTSTNKNVALNNNGGTFQGVILLPGDHYQSNSSNLFGRVYGGSVGNMQIVSGANVRVPPGPLDNTATVSATGLSSTSASATVSIN